MQTILYSMVRKITHVLFLIVFFSGSAVVVAYDLGEESRENGVHSSIFFTNEPIVRARIDHSGLLATVENERPGFADRAHYDFWKIAERDEKTMNGYREDPGMRSNRSSDDVYENFKPAHIIGFIIVSLLISGIWLTNR